MTDEANSNGREPNGVKNAVAVRPSVPTGRLRTMAEAESYLRVSEWALRKLVHEGRLPVVVLNDAEGSRWRFDVKDLDALVDRSKRVL
jgi:excisionase family DNA binding protein